METWRSRSRIDAAFRSRALGCPFGCRLCDALRFDDVFSFNGASLALLLLIEDCLGAFCSLAADRAEAARGL